MYVPFTRLTRSGSDFLGVQLKPSASSETSAVASTRVETPYQAAGHINHSPLMRESSPPHDLSTVVNWSPGAVVVSKCQWQAYCASVPPPAPANATCVSQMFAAAMSWARLTLLSFRPQTLLLMMSAAMRAGLL